MISFKMKTYGPLKQIWISLIFMQVFGKSLLPESQPRVGVKDVFYTLVREYM